MMLSDRIDSLIMEAMKAHDDVRTRTLRSIKAAFIEARTAKGAGEMNEAKELQVLKRMVKQREDSTQQYLDAGRVELANDECAEVGIIKEFLPAEVGRNEILAYIDSKYGNTINKQNMGLVIKDVKEHFPGADGALVAGIVKEKIVL